MRFFASNLNKSKEKHMTALDSAHKVVVESSEDLVKWLSEHHQQTESIWLVTYKKAVPQKYVSTEEILDALISFGWTDGIRRQVDDQRTMQLVSPRKAKVWAKSYRDRAERLIAEGRMQPAGLAAIAAAKTAGTWDSQNDVDELVIPDDLVEALKSRSAALENFKNFPPSIRRNILRWVATAKQAETRNKRIQRIASDASDNIRTPVNGSKKPTV
jgi:uncharacterized protein YdeI (YjbR/CyaY-like superfamily)